MASTAFNDEFTHSHGGLCFFVDVDPAFDDQAKAATVVARARPDADRPAFIEGLVDQAKQALPPPPEPTHDDEEEDDEPKRAQDTAETREAKRQVVAQLVASLEGHRLEAASDKEFEGLSNLVLSLVLSLYTPADADYPRLLVALADALTFTSSSPASGSSSKAPAAAAPSLAARYASLATLFNALPADAADLRLSLLLKLVAFAASNDDLAVVAPALAKLEHWLAEWNLGADRSNAAVGEIASALVSKGHAAEARALLLSHLSGAGASASESAAPLASTLVALSLAAPDVYDFHALSPARLPALSALPAPLATLLQRFQAPAASSALDPIPTEALGAVPGVELSADQLQKKLRLVALAELCADRVGATVAYGEIARACGVQAQSGSEEESEEVEGWVIDAIRASLLQGRLSQPTQTLHVSRASPVQAFTPAHWGLVRSRLEGWHASLARVRGTVDKALGGAGGAQGAVEVAAAGGVKDEQ
ncbi:hypothetical protein JCM10450v2_001499 [Rhodotorula kratochvilovae]